MLPSMQIIIYLYHFLFSSSIYEDKHNYSSARSTISNEVVCKQSCYTDFARVCWEPFTGSSRLATTVHPSTSFSSHVPSRNLCKRHGFWFWRRRNCKLWKMDEWFDWVIYFKHMNMIRNHCTAIKKCNSLIQSIRFWHLVLNSPVILTPDRPQCVF